MAKTQVVVRKEAGCVFLQTTPAPPLEKEGKAAGVSPGNALGAARVIVGVYEML